MANFQKGFTQIFLAIGLALVVLTIPLTVRLVRERQETRKMAREDLGCATCEKQVTKRECRTEDVSTCLKYKQECVEEKCRIESYPCTQSVKVCDDYEETCEPKTVRCIVGEKDDGRPIYGDCTETVCHSTSTCKPNRFHYEEEYTSCTREKCNRSCHDTNECEQLDTTQKQVCENVSACEPDPSCLAEASKPPTSEPTVQPTTPPSTTPPEETTEPTTTPTTEPTATPTPTPPVDSCPYRDYDECLSFGCTSCQACGDYSYRCSGTPPPIVRSCTSADCPDCSYGCEGLVKGTDTGQCNCKPKPTALPTTIPTAIPTTEPTIEPVVPPIVASCGFGWWSITCANGANGCQTLLGINDCSQQTPEIAAQPTAQPTTQPTIIPSFTSILVAQATDTPEPTATPYKSQYMLMREAYCQEHQTECKEIHSILSNNSIGINYPSKDPFTGLPVDENGNIGIPFDQLYPEIKTTEIIKGEIVNRGASNWQWDPKTLDYIFPNISNIRSQYEVQNDNRLENLLRNPLNRIPYVNSVSNAFYDTLDIGYLTPSLRRETFLRASDILNKGLNVDIQYAPLKNDQLQAYTNAKIIDDSPLLALTRYGSYGNGKYMLGESITFNSNIVQPDSNNYIIYLGHEGTHILDIFKSSKYSNPLIRQAKLFDLYNEANSLFESFAEYNAYQYQVDKAAQYGGDLYLYPSSKNKYQSYPDKFFKSYLEQKKALQQEVKMLIKNGGP